jgi:hypothetical protein
MAFNVTEFVTSRRTYLGKDTERATLEFVGFGSSDDAVARAGFRAAIQPTFTAMSNPLTLLSVEPYPMGGLFWRATALYGPDPAPLLPAVGIAGPPTPVPGLPGPNTPLGPNFAFDWAGVAERIYQSKETTRKEVPAGAPAANAPDHKGAIGVTADGKVEGAERLSPNMEFTLTHTFASVTQEYVDTVSDMVGSTNSAAWFNYPEKSLTFLGGSCQIDDTLKAKCTFKFRKGKNENTIVINDGFTILPGARGMAKFGSEYLWVRYAAEKDTAAKAMVQRPQAAYVERIVDAVDFTQLRIGG